MRGSAELALRPVRTAVPGGAVAVSGMPQRLGAAEQPAQLLLFADHLDRLRLRLSPQHFAQLWGQSHANLHAVLAERTDEEKALVRKHIDAGEAFLHLPLAANVEFDR